MKRIVLALTFLLATSSAAFAQFTPSTENLRGVTGVRLMVMLGHYPHRMDEAQKPEILKLVEADAAAKLEEAGIPFYTLPSNPMRNANAILVITVTMNEGKELMDNETEVKLLQSVRLSRDPSIQFEASTWSREGIVHVPKPRDAIQRQVAGEIDQFIRDYFSVNPKPSTGSSSSKVIRP